MKFLPKLLAAPLLFASITLMAQNFDSAVGARLGFPAAASYKVFINETDAIEGYGGIRFRRDFNEIRVAGAYQVHSSFNLEAEWAPLQWYYGAGASVGFIKTDVNFIVPNGGSVRSVSLGINGYIGLQYTFNDIPLEIILDWIPTINIGSSNLLRSFVGNNGGIGIRYILNR